MSKSSTTISRVVTRRAGARGRSRLALLGLLSALGALGAFLLYAMWPLYLSSRPVPDQTRCMRRLKILWIAFKLYAHDYDDVLPHKAWADALTPYRGSDRGSFCCPRGGKRYLYVHNAAILGYRLPDPEAERGGTPMLFDADGTWNLSGGRGLIEYAHGGAANVLTTDGLVLRIASDTETSRRLGVKPAGGLHWGTPMPPQAVSRLHSPAGGSARSNVPIRPE